MDPDLLYDPTFTIKDKAPLLGVSVGTVFNRVPRLHGGKSGRAPKFSAEEENHLEDMLLSCAKLGVPLNQHFFLKVLTQVGKDKGNLYHRTF